MLRIITHNISLTLFISFLCTLTSSLFVVRFSLLVYYVSPLFTYVYDHFDLSLTLSWGLFAFSFSLASFRAESLVTFSSLLFKLESRVIPHCRKTAKTKNLTNFLSFLDRCSADRRSMWWNFLFFLNQTILLASAISSFSTTMQSAFCVLEGAC